MKKMRQQHLPPFPLEKKLLQIWLRRDIAPPTRGGNLAPPTDLNDVTYRHQHLGCPAYHLRVVSTDLRILCG